MSIEIGELIIKIEVTSSEEKTVSNTLSMPDFQTREQDARRVDAIVQLVMEKLREREGGML